MTAKLMDGDYVKNGGSLEETEHMEELLQSLALAFAAERGSFYPNKDFGSALSAGAADDPLYAVGRAAQAVSGTDGVYVKSAEYDGGQYRITVVINNEERQVAVSK